MKPRADWRLCHPVNIYVFKNGVEGELPTLVHIPAAMPKAHYNFTDSKRSMDAVLEAVQVRVRFPVGYPTALYNMDGSQVCQTYELEMYENYIVVSNLDKRFRCAQYGRARSPLVVIGRESKNVRSMRQQNKDFDKLYIRRKQGNDKKLKYAFATEYKSDGFGPTDLPYVNNTSKACGVLCRKLKPFRQCENLPDNPNGTRCPSSENVVADDFLINYLRESFDMNSKTSQLRSFDINSKTSQLQSFQPEASQTRPPDSNPPPPYRPSEAERPQKPRPQMVDKAVDADQNPDNRKKSSLIDSDHLIQFVNRYRDIGGELNRLFTDRMSQNHEDLRNQLALPKLDKKLSRERRVGGDLERMFSERIETTDADHVSLVMEFSENKWSTASKPDLPSFGDLMEMNDGNTGNQRVGIASEGSSEELSKYESTSDRQKSLSNLMINENPNQATGTTTSTSRNPRTKILYKTAEEVKSPFVLQNGKLVIQNPVDNNNNIAEKVSGYPWESPSSVDDDKIGMKMMQMEKHAKNVSDQVGLQFSPTVGSNLVGTVPNNSTNTSQKHPSSMIETLEKYRKYVPVNSAKSRLSYDSGSRIESENQFFIPNSQGTSKTSATAPMVNSTESLVKFQQATPMLDRHGNVLYYIFSPESL